MYAIDAVYLMLLGITRYSYARHIININIIDVDALPGLATTITAKPHR